MIKLSEFPSLVGKPIYYSSFYDKEYYVIKPIKTNKVPRKGSRNAKLDYFWFDAEILESFGAGDAPWKQPGTIHSYSNGFMFKSFQELQKSIEPYKAKQIAFISAMALA